MFEIIVNNVGTVWTGTNHSAANRAFDVQIDKSVAGVVGNGGRESIIMLADGEIVREFNPS